MRRLPGVVCAVVPALLLMLARPAAADPFPAGPPNDPGYAPVENGAPLSCLTTAAPGGEQHNLYSFIPKCTPAAKDPEGAAGMSVDAAWRDYTTGSPDTVIAYVEAGINWHNGDVADLANKVYLNTGELPKPAGSDTYDRDGDGAVTAADYAADPRVHDTNGNGVIDPEDLIVAFSDGKDDDGDGFTDDISGWDFYDDQNDPATPDSTYGHANDQQRVAAARTDNGKLGAGICPKCRLLPIRAGDEALDRTDDLAAAWLYAGRAGAKVIVSTTADLGYSSAMRRAVDKLWNDGVVMVESSNDFDSTDHQGGMFWPHVVPGNGLVANAAGASGALANALTSTYRERSNLTSFGAKAMFSVATLGGSTSESTPTTGGLFGLLLSYGAQAAKEKKIDRPLTNAEAVQVLRATASDVDDASLGWAGRPGWDRQYGYGRPNAAKALAAVAKGDIPPATWIESPDWYSLYDPATTSSVPVTGHVDASRAKSFHYRLEFAPGIEPADSAFITAGDGQGTGTYDGKVGTLDLTKLPQSFWSKAYSMPDDKELSSTEQYTVTLRLRVWDDAGRMGEERRAIAVHHDDTLRAGFPQHFGIGGESQPALADLQATGHQAIVFGDADGRVHAIDGVSGTELPGWPATTNAGQTRVPGFDPGHEPIIAPVAVGDLFHDGRQEVVVTSTTGRTYVFDAQGRLLPGWPKTLDTGVTKPAIPRPALAYTRLPHQGATACPVLVDLDGKPGLEIVQAGWDGRLHAWHADGSDVPGWPVTVADPPKPASGLTAIDDAKLDATPAVADLDGDHQPEIVVRSQHSESHGAGIQALGANYVYAYHADGSPVKGWPVRVPSIITFYGSAQEFITEAANSPAVADVDGDGKDEVATGPSFSATFLIGGDGAIRGAYGPLNNPASALLGHDAAAVRALLTGSSPTPAVDLPASFTTSGAFGRFGDAGRLGYAESGSGAVSLIAALLYPGSGTAIANYERGYDAATTLPVSGYPHARAGLDFLGAPLIADVTGDGKAEVVDGGDTSTVHAFTPSGQAAGFPKFTGGWTLFSPSAGDLDGDGRTDLVTTTREGYLFAWKTDGKPDAESWTYHHDEWRTGRYGTDTRPPGAPQDLRRDGTTVSFVAPGDDGNAGRAATYRVSADGRVSTATATVGAGGRQSLTVPAGARKVVVQAVDDAGNLGPAAVL
ncbi:FG-GAP-like repeat-containing protein [Actinoallomurus sp. NPDC052308]|uniref:FG-GAP-like repeat-containing protein n=1 Tax=Actinoallomurus sp. NPDC052308 TaxID=3155530 RepID=UPI00343E3C83